MVIDCETQIMYVFGGRVVDGDWDTFKYSGLYSYNVRLSKWRLLQYASFSFLSPVPTHHFPRRQADNTGGSQIIIPSRFGHSMVLEPTSKTLFIFAGQRDERYLSDMYAYNITTNTASELFSNFTAAGGPDACFTQRAVIDPALKEMYVYVSLFLTFPLPALELELTHPKKVLWSDKKLRLRHTKHNSALVPLKLGLPIRHPPRGMGTDHAAPRDDGQ
jgi:hypothetical protein